VDDSERESWNV